ncbi:DEAD/DEAH box helicase [bacterium]|nr:DEAD/DEAH box helicase [bacterium]
MILRPYQQQGKNDILNAFQTDDIVMFVLATGGGKTVTFTEIMREFYDAGRRTLLVAHREELITQAWRTIHRSGMSAGIVKSGYPNRYEWPAQVGSIQTLARRKVLPEADLIIIDEGHHVTDDNTYGALIKSYPAAKVLIVTATPYRLTGKSFVNIVPEKQTKLIVNCQISDLIKEGWLVPFKYFVGSIPDLSGVPIVRGEYDEEGARKVMELAPLVESYQQHCSGMKGISYCINVAHSKEVAAQYNAAGIPAVHLDATSPQEVRDEVLQSFRDGVIKVVCNVGILTEGADFPDCQFVQYARPTMSLSMVLQMGGRVSRALTGLVDAFSDAEDRRSAIACSEKPYGIILDNAGCWLQHGFPDDERDWAHYFNGWIKQKKQEENPNFIEIITYVIEDPATGQRSSTKKISEVEGMILVEITRELKERLREPLDIGEFEKLYLFALNNSDRIHKPGYWAYYKMMAFLDSKSLPVSDKVWAHIKKRLLDNIDDEIDQYLNSCKKNGIHAIPSINAEVKKIRDKGIHKTFYIKEKEIYSKKVKV